MDGAANSARKGRRMTVYLNDLEMELPHIIKGHWQERGVTHESTTFRSETRRIEISCGDRKVFVSVDDDADTRDTARYLRKLMNAAPELFSELTAARARIAELEAERQRFQNLLTALHPLRAAVVKSDHVNTFPWNYLRREDWQAMSDAVDAGWFDDTRF